MNKQEFIKRLAENQEVSQTQTREFLDNFVETVTEILAEGEEISLIGFGKFSVVERAERVGRNPQTGTELVIPAKLAPKFTAGKTLKSAVNES